MQTDPSAHLNLPCEDIVQFKKRLESARRVDDRIQNELNSRLPVSNYFRSKVDPVGICRELFASLKCAHAGRESAIKRCIKLTEAEAKSALAESGSASKPKLGASHARLRQLQNELYEEEIIQRNTFKFLYERCRDVYLPDDLPTDAAF